ncbi:MAG: hypothetical protein J6Q30_00030 [Oscillospiraceae bacterium]|nr:hypothetical protein [Oscillospiraceae bacterium]
MRFYDEFLSLWNRVCTASKPILEKIGRFLKELWAACKVAGKLLYRMRKVFLAIPVAWAAVYLAFYNLEKLPKVVGLDLQITGDFDIQVVRELAVLGPVALTALCLLLMFVSRRTLTPWLVSIFTLALPLLILLTNVFPV